MRRVLWMLSLSALIPLIPFLVIGELPGERWLVATRDNAAWFGATGAALLARTSPTALIGLQSFRVIVEIVLWALATQHRL